MASRQAAREMSSTPAAQRVASALFIALLASASASAELSEYQYDYDELPRPHLAQVRVARDSPSPSHIQHVPADAPRAADAALSAAGPPSAIQRVPRAAAGGAAPAPAPSHAPAVEVPADPQGQAATQAPPVSGAQAQMRDEAPNVAANSHVPNAQSEVSSGTSSSGKKSDDMETANFFWGLGPVYPHLYVYRRVPHLVPLSGWNPYHSYYLPNPSRLSNQYYVQ